MTERAISNKYVFSPRTPSPCDAGSGSSRPPVPPQEAADLGVERDTPEHAFLERRPQRAGGVLGKRLRRSA